MTTTRAEFDPFSDEYFNDPTEVYRRLRDEAPVFHAEDLGFWALSRFEDVLAAAHDPARFASGLSGALSGHSRIPFPNLASLDDPRHGQLRALVSRAFAIRPVDAGEVSTPVRKYGPPPMTDRTYGCN